VQCFDMTLPMPEALCPRCTLYSSGWKRAYKWTWITVLWHDWAWIRLCSLFVSSNCSLFYGRIVVQHTSFKKQFGVQILNETSS